MPKGGWWARTPAWMNEHLYTIMIAVIDFAPLASLTPEQRTSYGIGQAIVHGSIDNDLYCTTPSVLSRRRHSLRSWCMPPGRMGALALSHCAKRHVHSVQQISFVCRGLWLLTLRVGRSR